MLALAAERRDWLSRPLGQGPAFDDADGEAARAQVAAALGDGGETRWLDDVHVAALLERHGIPLLRSERCPTPDDAVRAAAAIGGPVALKAAFAEPADASEIDAVLLGLEGETALRAGWDALVERVGRAGREWQGAIVQPLADGGVDVLVGALNHEALGVVAGVGAGGRQAGLYGDVAFRLAPATDVDAVELLAAAPVVDRWLQGGAAGHEPDRDALADCVLRLARLFEDVPELVEGDLNPVRLHPGGLTVLDARLRAVRRSAPERIRTW